MFSHKNGNAVKKTISQRFLDPTLLYLKKQQQKNLVVHIITNINYYENSTKAVNKNNQ